METIKSVANTASGYIYGQPTNENTTTHSGTEPMAGESGKGTVNEPYDKGNVESSSTEPSTTHSSTHQSSTTEPSTSTPNPTTTTDTPTASGTTSTQPSDRPSGLGPTNPADGADPSTGQQPFQKQQAADRPEEAPTSSESKGAVEETKEDGEELLKRRDPNDHSGEPMKMHDGSETKVNKEEEDGEHPGQEGGGKHGEDGTGEKWVKTSGLQADGGDFDAAQAGAGKEADRLLSDKGIQRDERGGMMGKDGEAVDPTDHKTNASSHEKVKTIDKIKEKLHIGTGKHLG